MARIVYNLNKGIAENIRFAKAAYALRPGELEAQGGTLPTQEALSDPAAWAAQAADVQAKAQARATAPTVEDLILVMKEKGVLTDQDIAKLRADKAKGKS